MNALLLNRNFELPTDGWFHVVPLGRFSHPKGLLQVLDDKASTAIVNRFKKDAAKDNFPGLLVDFDHFSDDEAQPSEAAGWVTDLQNREDGVWGQIRWSDTGEAAVKGGRYRLVSPVFNEADAEELSGGFDGVVANAAGSRKALRPLRLMKVALTNDPNLKGMVPLSNRAPGGEADVTTPNESNKTHMLKTVIALLGLSADASEEIAIAEVTKLKNRAASLEGTNKELLASQVESDLEKYKNRFKPESREKVKANLLSNRASAIELLEMMPEVAAPGARQALTPIHNRGTAKDPKVIEGAGEAEASDAAKASAGVILNRAKELNSNNPKRGWAACWAQAQSEATAKAA